MSKLILNKRFINVCLSNKGTNEKHVAPLEEASNKLNEIKKMGAVMPIFTLSGPKRPGVNASIEENKNYELKKEEFKKAKADFLLQKAEYEKYASDLFKKAKLAYLCTKKSQAMIKFLTQNQQKETKLANLRIAEILKAFEGGLFKPFHEERTDSSGRIYKIITGKQVYLKFTDQFDVPKTLDLVEWENFYQKVRFENEATNTLFANKDKITGNFMRFSDPIIEAIGYFLQVSVGNLITLAIKNNRLCTKKSTLVIDNFARNVICKSPFYGVFSNLDCLSKLDTYLQRQEDYEKIKIEIGNLSKTISKKSIVLSFVDTEKKEGYMVERNGVKRWIDLSPPEGAINITHQMAHLFDSLKGKSNMSLKISTKVKNFLALITLQFMQVLCNDLTEFQKLTAKYNRQNVLIREVKTVSFKNVEFLLRIKASSKNKDVTAMFDEIKNIYSNWKIDSANKNLKYKLGKVPNEDEVQEETTHDFVEEEN